jgi:hypothetical protein
MLSNLPLPIMNKITEYVSQMNDDNFVIKFCEVGKINKNTKRLCTCSKCKTQTRTIMRIVLNKKMIELKLVNYFNIKKTYTKQLVNVDNCTYDGDMICIRSKTITEPGWLGEDDEVRVYNTYIISYTTQYIGNKYIVLTDVCIINGIKICLDGIIVNPSLPQKNKITNIEKISFKIIPYNVINITTEHF